MHKALLIIGTRPELIKVAPVIHEMKRRGHRKQLIIVNTGQHKELMQKTFRFLGIKADLTLDLMVAGQSLNELMGRAMLQLQQLLNTLRTKHQEPGVILAQGDTATACAAALTAFHNRIPFAHIEAGLRTKDFANPFPEEYYRRIISIKAERYFTPTIAATNNLIAEGVKEEQITLTGNTVVDALEFIQTLNPIKSKRKSPVIRLNRSQKNILVTCHRRENFGQNISSIIQTINDLAKENPSCRFTWLLHMNPSVRTVVKESGLDTLANVDFVEPLDYFELVRLYSLIDIIITDSGGIQEEAPSFKIPVIVLRETTERMESVDNGFAFLCGADPKKIKEAFNYCISNKVEITFNPFGDGKASQRIVDCLDKMLRPEKTKKVIERVKYKHDYQFKTLVIGSGPAGTGLLFNALRKNKLNDFLDDGVAFLDKADNFCGGTIGKYIINSDTVGGVFLECLSCLDKQSLDDPRLHKLIHLISNRYAGGSAPLEWIGNYLSALGKELKKMVNGHKASHIFSHTTAINVTRVSSNEFYTHVRTENGSIITESVIKSSSVVFAMGGKQEFNDISERQLASGFNLKTYTQKIKLTDELFTRNGITNLQYAMQASQNKKVVVIGSSHSALSTVWLLLNRLKGIEFLENDITLLHRSKLKIFYHSREAALADGYTDFTEDDICPVTQKVHRLAGLRLDSRELLKQVLGMNGQREKRVELVNLSVTSNDPKIKYLLDEASVIVPAFGYRPGVIPIIDGSGNALHLSGEKGGPLVNNFCQVIDQSGKVIDGLYGIGLASGFIPWGKLGGEPGFTGQTNGLWLYQNGVGELIFDQLMNLSGGQK